MATAIGSPGRIDIIQPMRALTVALALAALCGCSEEPSTPVPPNAVKKAKLEAADLVGKYRIDLSIPVESDSALSNPGPKPRGSLDWVLDLQTDKRFTLSEVGLAGKYELVGDSLVLDASTMHGESFKTLEARYAKKPKEAGFVKS